MVGRRHPLAALIFTDGRVCSFDGRTLVFEHGLKTAGKFSVPMAVLEQLAARNASYPVTYSPWTDAAAVPWLAPGRLLLFVKHAPPPPYELCNASAALV